MNDWCDCAGFEHLCGGERFPKSCPDWQDNKTAGGDPNLQHGRGIHINRLTEGWNAAAACFAYGFGTLAERSYKYVGQDQLVRLSLSSYPTSLSLFSSLFSSLSSLLFSLLCMYLRLFLCGSLSDLSLSLSRVQVCRRISWCGTHVQTFTFCCIALLFVVVLWQIGGTWPDNEPAVSCMDWTSGQVNAKYWVTQLLAQTVGTKEDKVRNLRHTCF